MTLNTPYSSKYPVYHPKSGHTTFYILLLNSKIDSQKRVFAIGYSQNPNEPLSGINTNSDLLWHHENFNMIPELINLGQVKNSNVEEAYREILKLYQDKGYRLGEENSDFIRGEWAFTYKGIRDLDQPRLEEYLKTKVERINGKKWKARWSPAQPKGIIEYDKQQKEKEAEERAAKNSLRTSPRRAKKGVQRNKQWYGH
jgi:hypothetical protein